MLFNSYVFLLIFVPVVYGLYWLALPAGARLLFLILAGYVFYSYSSPWPAALLLAISLVTWATGLLVTRYHRRGMLLLGIVLILAPLLVTKYAGFILTALSGLANRPVLQIVLPIGISFYTFEALSYVVDVYNNRVVAENSPLNLIAYLAFFPNLIAGPIVRYGEIGPVLKKLPRMLPDEKFLEGLVLVVSGLAYKVLLADTLGSQVNRLLATPEKLGFWAAWSAIIGYGFQLYYDFAGYSKMATGLAAWFGITTPSNFNRPYLASNISEFWTRWHITLSSWVRDYIFFPLSRGLLARLGRRLAWAVIITADLVTMIILGLWHGAGWTFILWGAYHGILLIFYQLTRPLNLIRWRRLSILLTFAVVMLGWVLFRSTSLSMAISLYRSILGLQGFESFAAIRDVVGSRMVIWIGIALILEIVIPPDLERRVKPRWTEAIAFCVVAIWALLSIGTAQRFLYFQF